MQLYHIWYHYKINLTIKLTIASIEPCQATHHLSHQPDPEITIIANRSILMVKYPPNQVI